MQLELPLQMGPSYGMSSDFPRSQRSDGARTDGSRWTSRELKLLLGRATCYTESARGSKA